uniref:G-protein coupled receptors family 1 profile domain-containing protein n=1 Tax=Chinchilla lanigera TaxID=34839 RepID=A0A8C2UKV1_CHILA
PSGTGKCPHENSSTDSQLILASLFFLFSVIYLTSCAANATVITLVALESSLQAPMYFFLCRLAFLNVSFSTTVVPKMLFNLLVNRKVISSTFCLAQTCVTLSLEATECFLLAVMALGRYVAICYPLGHLLLMCCSVCVALAAGAWTVGFFASVVPLYIIILSLCGPSVVDYIFCELPIVPHMFCGDTALQESMMVLLPFILIIISYLRILVARMRMDSMEGRKKAFEPCTSHLAVVTLCFRTGLIRYLRPNSEGKERKVTKTPMLNPFIYSLRTREAKGALNRAMQRLKSIR